MKRTILNIILVIIVILLLLLNCCSRMLTQKTDPEMKPKSAESEVEEQESDPIFCELRSVPKSDSSCNRENLSSDPFFIVANMEDATLLAKAAYGEYRGLNDEEVLAVYWCILNRVDAEGYGMGNDIEYVLTFPHQFLGYSPDNPVDDRLIDLACEALTVWETEKMTGELSDERVIPPEYLWFSGNEECTHNTYRNTFEFCPRTDYITWSGGEKITIIN